MWAQGFQEEDLEALEGHATNLGDADSTSAHTPTDPARRVNAASVAGLAGGASAGAAAAAAEADAEAGSGHGAAGEAKELPLPPGWTKKAMSKSNGKMEYYENENGQRQWAHPLEGNPTYDDFRV
mmetsp:Transcript_65236/g.147135  ORF Transcript_65236/g.147135 Transcript_65236/m.147135 type:complete len:125 (+) Transcript_65236:236-610(+)